MKVLRFLGIALVVMTLSINFAACGDDEEYIQDTTIPSNNNGLESSSSEYADAQIASLIRENVTISRSYSNYAWSFHIESTLHNELPNKTIRFGIGHGDINGTTTVSVENQAYQYTSSNRNGIFTADFVNPFYFYYIFGKGKNLSGASKVAEFDLYYRSYAALIEKGVNNLHSDERDLYNEIVKIFKEYEPEFKNDYSPSIKVYIENKYYKVN